MFLLYLYDAIKFLSFWPLSWLFIGAVVRVTEVLVNQPQKPLICVRQPPEIEVLMRGT